MSKASFTIVNPNAVIVRLECEAPVAVWRTIAESLRKGQIIEWDPQVVPILNAIQDATNRVDERFVGLAPSERDDT